MCVIFVVILRNRALCASSSIVNCYSFFLNKCEINTTKNNKMSNYMALPWTFPMATIDDMNYYINSKPIKPITKYTNNWIY